MYWVVELEIHKELGCLPNISMINEKSIIFLILVIRYLIETRSLEPPEAT